MKLLCRMLGHRARIARTQVTDGPYYTFGPISIHNYDCARCGVRLAEDGFEFPSPPRFPRVGTYQQLNNFMEMSRLNPRLKCPKCRQMTGGFYKGTKERLCNDRQCRHQWEGPELVLPNLKGEAR